MDILHRDELPKGGFAGVREHQLVTDPRAFGPDANVAGYVRAPESGFSEHVQYLVLVTHVSRSVQI